MLAEAWSISDWGSNDEAVDPVLTGTVAFEKNML